MSDNFIKALFPGLGDIEKDGYAMFRDKRRSVVRGLSYSIESGAVYDHGKICRSYLIEIGSWEYTVHSYGVERPVFSMRVTDKRGKKQGLAEIISDMKSVGVSLPLNDMSARRAVVAVSYFIDQINQGVVFDVEKALLMHRMHPSQADVYEEKGKNFSDFFRHLIPAPERNRLHGTNNSTYAGRL